MPADEKPQEWVPLYTPEWLTDEERAELRRSMEEASEYGRKAFAHRRLPK